MNEYLPTEIRICALLLYYFIDPTLAFVFICLLQIEETTGLQQSHCYMRRCSLRSGCIVYMHLNRSVTTDYEHNMETISHVAPR